MNKTFNIGDIVQVYDHSQTGWSKPYKIYMINSPDDKNVIGYCHQKSYWMRSIDNQYERTWYCTDLMRHVGSEEQSN